MTLRMADGPVANLPPGMDAYAGYTNDSGIGETWPAIQVLAQQQKAVAFSITTNHAVAQCADVEKGAMNSWAGYNWGYCSVGMVNGLIAVYGRPQRLWTAHYDPAIGAHICSPECWPGLATTADGTQWTNHGGAWDESLLNDNFFTLPVQQIPIPTTLIGAIEMDSVVAPNGDIVSHYRTPENHLLEVTRKSGTQMENINPEGQPENLNIQDITAKYPQFQVVG